MQRTAAILAVALVLAGCVTSGNQRLADAAAVTQGKEGLTKEQVRGLVGEPSGVTTLGNGEEVWSYVLVNTTNAAAFVPIVGLFAGRSDSQTSTLTVSFRANGTVKSTSRNRTNSQARF